MARLSRRTLAALALLAALPLAGCSLITPTKTLPSLTTTKAAATPSPTATPTPTARLLSKAEAQKRYLDVVCPADGYAIEMGRANQHMADQVAPMSEMAAKARPLDVKMLASFQDSTVRWPLPANLVADEVTLSNADVAYDAQIAHALTMDQLNSVIQEQNAQTLPSPGKAVRQALGLNADITLACNGYATAAGPAGYPKVVSVASLPSNVASYFQDEKRTPVALGPGVWTTLDPGTTVGDAVVSGNLEGYCTSIKVFEQKYVFGQEIAGGCW